MRAETIVNRGRTEGKKKTKKQKTYTGGRQWENGRQEMIEG